MGQIAAAQKICTKIKVDMGSVALIMVAHKVDLDDPLQYALMERKATETILAWDGKGEDAACLAVMLLYGPGGANVPDILSWK